LNKIDPIKLKDIWNAGIKAGKSEAKIIAEAAKTFKCTVQSINLALKRIGLHDRKQRAKIAVTRSTNALVRKVFEDSHKLYQDNINLIATSQKILAHLDAIIDLNRSEMENAKGKGISKKTLLQQNQIMKAAYNLNQTLKTLIQYEETIANLSNYTKLKQAVVYALEKTDEEIMRKVAALTEANDDKINSIKGKKVDKKLLTEQNEKIKSLLEISIKRIFLDELRLAEIQQGTIFRDRSAGTKEKPPAEDAEYTDG